MSRRLEWIVVGALMAGVVLAIAVAPNADRSPVEQDFRLSTRNADPAGAKGLADVLREFGMVVEERLAPFFGAGERLPVDGTVVALLAPSRRLTLSEGRELARFVERGGRLVLVGEATNPAAVCFGWRATSAADRLRLANRSDAPEVYDVLHPIAPDSVVALGGFDEAPCEPVAVASVDTLLAGTDGEPVAVRVHARRGGRVTAVAAANLLRNQALRETSIGPWAVDLFVREAPARVIVDEYHHGYGEGGSLLGVTWGWLTSAPLGSAILQLAFVSLVALAVSMIRFGPPVSVLGHRRRSPLEHVDALAAGLAGARGAAPAVELMVSGLRRRVGRAGQSARDDLGGWLDALARTRPAGQGRAAVALADLIRRGPRSDADVVHAAHAVEDLWEALRTR